jgi:hypothetical protein
MEMDEAKLGPTATVMILMPLSTPIATTTAAIIPNFTNTLYNNDSDPKKVAGLPIEMQFNDGHLLSIVVYSILLVFSAIGNLSVLVTIIK